MHIPDKKFSHHTRAPPSPSLAKKLSIYFNDEDHLKKVQLILQYFENDIDNEGNIISPPNTNKNVINIIHDFPNSKGKLENEDINYYKHMIYNLNIPISLIENKYMKNSFTSLQINLPVGGCIERKKLINKKIKNDKKNTRKNKFPNKWNTF